MEAVTFYLFITSPSLCSCPAWLFCVSVYSRLLLYFFFFSWWFHRPPRPPTPRKLYIQLFFHHDSSWVPWGKSSLKHWTCQFNKSRKMWMYYSVLLILGWSFLWLCLYLGDTSSRTSRNVTLLFFTQRDYSLTKGMRLSWTTQSWQWPCRDKWIDFWSLTPLCAQTLGRIIAEPKSIFMVK